MTESAERADLSRDANPRAAAFAGSGIEVAVVVLVVLIPLFFWYSLNDNLLAKGALTLILTSIIALLWVFQAFARRELRLLRMPLYLPFLLFVGVSILSLLFAQNQIRGLEEILSHVLMFALFAAVAHQVQSPRQAARVIWFVTGTTVTITTIGILQYNGIDPIGLPKVYGRLPLSTLGNTNLVAHYLDLVIPLLAALLILGDRRRWWQTTTLIITLALAGTHLVLTVSRGGWVSVASALLLLLLMVAHRWRWRRLLVIGVVILALVSPVGEFALRGIQVDDDRTLYEVAEQHSERALTRALSTFDATNYSRAMRTMIWLDTAAMIEAHPILGVGPGNFEFLLTDYRSVPAQRAWAKLMGKINAVPYFAHNEYLEIWAETGLVGVVAIAWFLGALLWFGFKQYRRSEEERETDSRTGSPWSRRALTAGCLSGLAAAVVHALFSFNFQDATSATHIWLFAGLIVGLNSGGLRHLHVPLRSDARRAAILAAGIAVAGCGAYIGLCTLIGDAYYFQALRHSKFHHYENALGLLRQAVDWRDQAFKHHHELGRIALSLGNHEEAENALRRSLELHPSNPGAMRLLGRALIEQARSDEAVPVFKRAVGIDPLKIDNHTLLADALSRSGRHEDAIEVRRQALALRPDNATHLMSLGIEYLKAGLTTESIAALERAVKLRRNNGMMRGNPGAAYLQAGRYEEATEQLLEAVRVEPDRSEWSRNLIISLVAQQRHVEALSEAQRLLAQDPSDEERQDVVRQLETVLEETGGQVD